MKKQSYKDAIINTQKMLSSIKISDNTRSINNTIGYLIKNNIHIKYLGLKGDTYGYINIFG